MQYFVPRLKLSADLPPQTKLTDKVGGLPWGLPPEQYPTCSDCGRSQALIIQLVHHPERLDLGKAGRTLLVFQCSYYSDETSPCEIWAGGHGANACLVAEPEDLVNQLTPLPSDDPELYIEAVITNWVTSDDGIPPECVQPNGEIYSLSDDDDFFELGSRAESGTKLGGAPLWQQDQGEAPQQQGWRFVAQLDEQYELEEKPTATDPVTADLMQRGHIHLARRYHQESDEWREDGKWEFSGPNFGTGLAYVFVRMADNEIEGWVFSQC